MSTPVCIANAVADALSTLPHASAIPELRLPLTPTKLAELIARGEGTWPGTEEGSR